MENFHLIEISFELFQVFRELLDSDLGDIESLHSQCVGGWGGGVSEYINNLLKKSMETLYSWKPESIPCDFLILMCEF